MSDMLPSLRTGKLFILGHGRHGKDTFAELIREHIGPAFKFVSSSLFVCEQAVLPTLTEKYGYSSLKECYADRSNHRSEWFDLIAAYNAEDPARMAREMFEEYDAYVGIRRIEEFRAVYSEGLVDLSLWVDRSEQLPPEPDDSCTITKEDCDLIVDNNGTLEQLRRRAVMFANVFFPFDPSC